MSSLRALQAAGAPISLGSDECFKTADERESPGQVPSQPNFVFPAKYGDPYYVRAGPHGVRVRPLHAKPAALGVALGLLAYEDVFPGAHVYFDVRRSRAEELILLDGPQAPHIFQYELVPQGGARAFALDQRGNLQTLDASGRTLFVLSAPVVFDSRGRSVPGRYRLERRRGADARARVLTMNFAPRGLRYPVLVDPQWTSVGIGTMTYTRTNHSATLLPGGKVLAAGGQTKTNAPPYRTSTAEIYDPALGAWAPTGSMSANREGHTATLLTNGKVLVTGGYNDAGIVSTAELYDPALGQWSSAGSLSTARTAHVAVRLSDGRILVAGGLGTPVPYLASAEIYDPISGLWTLTGPMTTARSDFTATLLNSGKVLVTGGWNGNYAAPGLSSAEIFDPASGTWTAAADMTYGRSSHAALLLPNGRVLVAGGVGTAYLKSAELYDASAGTWTVTGSMTDARAMYRLALLPDGKALAAGGFTLSSSMMSKTELYDSATGSWQPTGAMRWPRSSHAATLLSACGHVLVSGGARPGSIGAEAEIYSQAEPLPAGVLTAESRPGQRIRLDWAPSPSIQTAGYHLYFDSGTGVVDYQSPLAALDASATTFLTAPLQAGLAYRFGLRARDACGAMEQNTNVAAAAVALANPAGLRAAIKAPAGGRRVSGNRVTVLAELPAGASAATAQVLFQYKAAGTAVWTPITAADARHPNPSASPPYFIHWDATALPAGDYDLRAVAVDPLLGADPAPPSVTVAIDPVAFDSSETSLGGGKVQKQQTVYRAVTNTLYAADEASQAVARVVFPAGSVSAATATVRVVSNATTTPPAPAALSPVGAAVEIALLDGQTVLAGGQKATVTLRYPDADNDGIVDGTTIRAERLRIFSFNAASGQWVADLDSSVDLTQHLVTAQTPHLSFFQAFAAAASDLSSVRIYPIPFKPNGGNPDEGLAYSPGNGNSGIVFDNLPPSASIIVYTAAGQQVARIGSESTSGKLQWDARNESGRDVASGIYIAIISSPGHAPVTKKLLVIR